METAEVKEREYGLPALKILVERMQKRGWKVYTFESNGKIRQVHYSHENKIGTAWCTYGQVSIGTVHHANPYSGTGFGMNKFDNPTATDAEQGFCMCPHGFVNMISTVRKYKSWEDYIKNEKILKFYEIPAI